MYMHASRDRLLSKNCYLEILRVKPDIIAVTLDGPHLILQREPQKAADLVAAFMSQLGI